MAIKISVSQPEHEKIRVTVHEQESPRTTQVSLDLKARRTLDGNILIFDHKDIDIVLMPSKRKIIAFESIKMNIYYYQKIMIIIYRKLKSMIKKCHQN